MQIYLQEIAATVYFPRLPHGVKAKLIQLAYACPALLSKMKLLQSTQIPESAWYHLLQMKTDGNHGINFLGGGAKHAAKSS